MLYLPCLVALPWCRSEGGRIVDCAFTIAFNERYDPIIEASQAGTNTGVKEAGIDARFQDIGAAIQETIESYEIELNLSGTSKSFSVFGS